VETKRLDILNPRQRQTLLWLAVAVAIVVVIVLLGPVLTPFVAAGILGYMLLPLVERLVKLKVPRILAVMIVILTTILVILGLLFLIVPIVQKEVAQIKLQLPSLTAQITGEVIPKLKQWLNLDIKLDAATVKAWLTEHMASGGTDVAATVFNYAKSGWSAALEVIGLVFLVPVVLFYVLLDYPRIKPKAIDLVPPRWREQGGQWAGEIDHMLSQYLHGQLKVMAALAVYYCVALVIGGFDLWLPIGILTGMLVFIPYLGFALGLVFALGAGLLQFGLAKGLILVAVIYGIGQGLESIVLTPKLVGEQIGLHPLAVILALLAFGYLLGFIGVLLALPISACLVVGLRHVHRNYLASPFYKQG
jgi:predicted PurR-regulated permease PerM